MRAFHPLPVLERYFSDLLDQLAARGIPVTFLSMPMNEATAHAVDPEVRAGFRAWLAGYEARYPGFRVVGEVMPHWPNAFFGDGFSHLNPAGAALFNSGLGPCLEASAVSDACVHRLQAAPPNRGDTSRREGFTRTEPDAPDNARPDVKRGS